MYTHTHSIVDGHEQAIPFSIPEDTRARLIESLDSWHFEPHKLPDDEVLYCSYILFETLLRIDGLQESVRVSIEQIADLLYNLRKVYRSQNAYHNFEHAVDVLQAIHRFLSSAGRVPPVSILSDTNTRSWKPDKPSRYPSIVSVLEPEDLFCLYVSSIGHDVGHPGFTNNFMKNAKAPLSSLYDDKSPLEQLHCTLLLHILRNQGMGFLLDDPRISPTFRKLMLETVLATDMRVHYDFMARFQRIVNAPESADLWEKKVAVCQALIKCADISNPCRPLRVSQHWADALMNEWTEQASLEQQLQLPPSVTASEDPMTAAKSQIWFIETFAKPLFDLTAAAIPETAEYAAQCNENLELWGLRVRVLSAASPDPPVRPAASASSDPLPLSPSQLPEAYLNAFPMALPSSLLAEPSRTPTASWPTSPYSALPPLSHTRGASSASSSRASSPAPAPPLSTTSSSPSLSPSELSSASSDAPPSRALSIVSATAVPNVQGGPSSSSTVAIRAAYKAASVRKKSSFHRNSWSPGSRSAPLALGPAAVAAAGGGVSARRDMVAIVGGDP
ncbi:HD-domain/PDEase-like protein [Auriscalpium vulgare]|uniref:HD-domain/PDEase-like protein n=1 Tax=Auriscalpium vulgare TaxID=40419 RepID=A0ACB8S4H4_9AGAM|nr:HD-domain/PDEase-like protein [Auriscalpium vulgare]